MSRRPVHLARTEEKTWCGIPIRRMEDGVWWTTGSRQPVAFALGTVTCGRCRAKVPVVRKR